MRMEDQLAYLVASLNRQLEDELEERLQPGGVPIEQFRILDILNAREKLPMGELATLSLIEPPTLTKIVDRMVNDAIVYRAPDPEDRRRVLILAAPAGKALYKRLKGVSSAQEKRIVNHLSTDKAEELKALLRQLIAT